MTQLSFDPFSIDDDDDNNNIITNDARLEGTIASTNRVASRTRRDYRGTTNNSISTNNTTSKLPARLNIRLVVHEEVSSTAVMDSNNESSSTSQLDIEGKVVVRAKVVHSI